MRHLRRDDFRFPPIYLDVDGDVEEFTDFPAIAKAYAESVVEGREPACRYVKLACKRYLRMLRRAADPNAPFTFSPAHAVDFLDFWEKCPVGDNWRGENYVEKEPFQVFIGCSIYGFRRKDRWQSRWVNWVYLEIPRKHDKSGTAAVIGLYDGLFTLSKEPNIIIGAASEDQAKYVFNAAARIISEETELAETHKIEVTQKIIRFGKNRGLMQKLATIPKNQDGWNPSTIILDELHSQNPGLYQVLKSAMGARSNQLMFQITTAGRQAWGLGWEERTNAIRVLQGENVDDRMFALIFTVDDEDLKDEKRLLTDEDIWIKANPMWGVSIDPDSVRSFAQKARFSPVDREEFFRTRLNIWSNAATGLVDPQAWAECADPTVTLETMVGRKCWIGVDLSHYRDMTAIVFLFEELGYQTPIFGRFYLPESSPTLQSPNLHALMMDWHDRGELIIQPTGKIDLDALRRDILVYCEVFDVQSIGYDHAAGGSELFKTLYEDDGIEYVFDFPNRPTTMTVPTEDLMASIASRQLVHDGSECLRWHMLNAVGDIRANGTILPKKDGPNSERKIDGFVAAVMANAMRMGAEGIKARKKSKEVVDPYLKRGLLGAETVSNGSL
ncbi:terminase large subunit [Pleomorphomonas sp. PLEO]|uniref:terminase large subunit n=1 Tax=Pleomorphomonas sp. PLEO TaxID=3239306 RepID=UPI00351F0540